MAMALKEKYDGKLAELQKSAGCLECRFRDGTLIGLDCVCNHPEGFKQTYGQLRCANQRIQTQDYFTPAA